MLLRTAKVKIRIPVLQMFSARRLTVSTLSERMRSGYDKDQLQVSPVEQFSDILLESSIFAFPSTNVQ